MSLRNLSTRAMAAAAVGLLTASAYAAVSLPINNGDFHTGNLTGWSTDGVVTIADDGGQHGYVAHWNGGGWHYGGFYEAYNNPEQVIAPAPATDYTLSFDIKVLPGSSGDVYFLLDSYFEAPETAYPQWTISTDSAALADGDWHTLSYDFTSRTNWRNFGMAFQTQGNPGNPNVYMDNFQINPVPEPASIAVLGLASLTVLRRRRSA